MKISIEAQKIHQEAIIIDAHCDSIGRVYEGQRRLGDKSTIGQFDFPRAIAGGLTTEMLALFYDTSRPGDGVMQSMQFTDIFFQEIEENAEKVVQVTSAQGIRKAKKEGKLSVMLSIEGAEGLGGDLRVLRNLYRLGLRVMGLAWNRRNEAADGVGEMDSRGGLTKFGRALVKECETLGMLIDISHLAPTGVEDLLAIYQGPVIATHSNSYAVWPHSRNLKDDVLDEIAKRGGVVGVVPAPPFLSDYNKTAQLAELLDHIEYMVHRIGEDHVGFGGDFDGLDDMRVIDLEDVSKLPNLTQAMLDRNYKPETIKKILGGNFLRVIEQVMS